METKTKTKNIILDYVNSAKLTYSDQWLQCMPGLFKRLKCFIRTEADVKKPT